MRSGLINAMLSGGGVFGSALGWLMSFKILAFWLGPEGVGLFAQLRQIAQAATLGATYGGSNVVVQGLADCHVESARRKFRFIAARLTGVTSVGVVLLMLVAAPQLTWLSLSSEDPTLIRTVRWLALAAAINIASTYLMAVLNGYRSFGYLALAQVSGPATLCLFLLFASQEPLLLPSFAMPGAFVACFAVTCLIAAWGVTRLYGPDASSVGAELVGPGYRALLRFALSSLFAAMSTVLALLIIRSWIIETGGLGIAGLFDAGWTLTFNYTTLFLTACNMVYLPMLTAARAKDKQQACVLKMAYLILGGSLFACYGLVLFQGPIIRLFYSSQFEASGPLLSVLAIAVVFRGVSWVYGTLMLATRAAKVMLVSELVLNLGLLVAVRIALDSQFSLSSLGWAFVVSHAAYAVFTVEYACARNSLLSRLHIWPLLLIGVLPLIYLMRAQVPVSLATLAETWPYMFVGVGASVLAFRAYMRVEA